MSVYDMLKDVVQSNPYKVALWHDDDYLTYKDLLLKVDGFCNCLVGYGVTEGKRVALYIQQSIDFVVAAFSVSKIGAIIVPINTHITEEDIQKTLDYANSDFVITSRLYEHKIRDIAKGFKIITVDDYPGSCNQSSFLDDQPFVYITTSGSTGIPKVVEVSRKAFLKRMEAERILFDLSEEDTVLVSMPLYHACGFRMSFTALTKGMTLVILSGFTPERWVNAVVNHSVTYTIAVPTQLSKIVKWCKLQHKEHIFDSLSHLSSASAFLSENLRNEVLSIFSGNFYNMYASSETDFIALTRCSVGDDINVLGVITPNEEVLIDKNNPNDMTGEICCRSDWLLTRYYNDDEKTKATIINGYFHTGDLGRFEGNILYYGGRKKNIIISGGINIIPDDIESKIMELPFVDDCVAYGVEDNVLGEAVCVSVKIKRGFDPDEKAIRKHCLKRLADFQQPRIIKFTDTVIRNSMGKIVRG